MILISGAGGKTGLAVARALARRGAKMRLFVRRPPATLPASAESYIGDMTVAADWRAALRGVRKMYHICPNMHPQEVEIGRMAIEAAQEATVDHFVYHSVLHPQAQKMPHHWNKLRVEEMLFESSLPFTIVQPTAYMQNIRLSAVAGKQHYAVPYSVSAQICLVDLEDVATAAALVLTEDDHVGATYELVGTRPLSQVDVGAALGVAAMEVDRREWRKSAEKGGLSPYAINTLIAMFDYYDAYGLIGARRVLHMLLGRAPTTLHDYAARG